MLKITQIANIQYIDLYEI